MFSQKEKQWLAGEIEKLILSLNHPEMPKENPDFKLLVIGKEPWSYARIEPNHTFNDGDGNKPGINPFNEKARDILR